jgi:hypothetical protein
MASLSRDYHLIVISAPARMIARGVGFACQSRSAADRHFGAR